MIEKLEELNATYVNQYTHMNGTIDMHYFTSYLTTIYSYLINYPLITFMILQQKEFFNSLIVYTDLLNYFTYFSTYQSKVHLYNKINL